MGYKSAAAALGKYYSALERQNAGSVNATYKASKGGPEKFKKDDYKFSKGIVSKQNTDIKDYKNEMGYKIAMSTISDAMTAGNMGELLGDKLNKMAAKKFQNKITDMGVKARVGQLSTDLPTDLNVIPMSDHLKKFLQKQKSTTYDFNKFGKYSY